MSNARIRHCVDRAAMGLRSELAVEAYILEIDAVLPGFALMKIEAILEKCQKKLKLALILRVCSYEKLPPRSGMFNFRPAVFKVA